MDGAEIRSLRKALSLTQEEFAHRIGVTFATVNRWENGKSKPSRLAVKTLEELSRKTKPARSRSKRRRPSRPAKRRR